MNPARMDVAVFEKGLIIQYWFLLYPARMGVAVRQVRSKVRKGTTCMALVPTVIGVGEEEFR
jgi:hypothetical protein